MTVRIIVTIAWAMLILYLSTTSSINLLENVWDLFSTDKLGHFGIYGILTFLLLLVFFHPDSKWQSRGVRMALIISILYGISMEVMQYAFFPGRYFENLDIIANIIGSLTGLFFFKFFNKKS